MSNIDRPLRILLLEDNPSDATLCVRKLKEARLDLTVDVVATEKLFKEKTQAHTYDVNLVDYRLPDWTGMDAIRWLRSIGNRTPAIMVTGTMGDELAVECVKQGATDYVLKDKMDRLPHSVQRALDEQVLRDALDRAELKLRALERQYHSTVDAAPCGICQVDEDGTILLANPAMMDMLGNEIYARIQENELTHGPFKDPVERQRVFRGFEMPSSSVRQEVIWRRRDGKQIVSPPCWKKTTYCT